MPLQSSLADQGKGLCLLSLDAGGTRGISQLKILAELMHRMNFKVEEGEVLLPCDVFDMIGGSGSGGFIAILLVVFGLSAEHALDEFLELSDKILEEQELDPAARTAALGSYVDRLIQKYEVEKNVRLLDTNARSKGSRLVIPILHNRHIGHVCVLRNFEAGKEELNSTIAEAILATLASPPLFTPASISNFEYISGDLRFSNPTLTIVSEAYKVFGEEARVACLMSLGSGHPGFLSPPRTLDLDSWNQFLDKALKDSEQKAEEIETLIGNLGLYHRFSVTRGLEEKLQTTTSTAGDAIEYAMMYLAGIDVSRKLEICIDSLKLRDGTASLGQLKYPGDQNVLAPALPLPTRSFVMRKKPWEFLEKVMLNVRDDGDINEPRMLVVTGMGGCGKTQLILKFAQVHKDKFAATLFIDGSSVPRIHNDTIRHVRSLGIPYSQQGFEDCLLFLTKPRPGAARLILYDNVDDPDIELRPLLPSGESCAIVVTSRNRSLGQLCPDAHLELDTMSMDEAVDLLLHHPGPPTVITAQIRETARSIARTLGCLPIALTQARSYMFQTQCSGGEYVVRLLDSRNKLLAAPVKHNRDMRYVSTYAAFDASFTLLALRCQNLLRLLSHFHWANFPLELVIIAAKYNFSDYECTYLEHGDEYYAGKSILQATFLHEGKWDPTELDEMVVSLQNHSLVTLLPGASTRLVQMHPVTHGWVKSCVFEEPATYEAAAILLLALGARNAHTPASQYLASHVSHMSGIWDELGINNAEAFGNIMHKGGLYWDAVLLRERVVTEIRSWAEPGSKAITSSLWCLARSYHRMGRLKEAVELYEEVLKLSMEVLGEMHPETILASNSLANTYSERMGRLKEAEVPQEEVLKLSMEVLGEIHPDTISASNNLAFTYRDLGRLNDALTLQEGVLKLRNQVLGTSDPGTIIASNNLAVTYRELGRLAEAEKIQLEVVAAANEIMGPRHPRVLWISANLAGIYYALGRFTEAQPIQEEILRLRKEVLGDFHPDTINAVKNLANTYCRLGRLIEAKTLHEKVLRWREEALEERHPATITARAFLAVTLYNLGELNEAESLQAGVLAMRTEIFGEQHHKCARVMLDMAETCHALGKTEQAIKLATRANTIISDTLGESHPVYLRSQEIISRIQSDANASAHLSPLSTIAGSSLM